MEIAFLLLLFGGFIALRLLYFFWVQSPQSLGSYRQTRESAESSAGAPHQSRILVQEKAVDPVCGETIHTEKAKSSVHDGVVYFFCSRDCREIFEAAPGLYLQNPDEEVPQILGPARPQPGFEGPNV